MIWLLALAVVFRMPEDAATQSAVLGNGTNLMVNVTEPQPPMYLPPGFASWDDPAPFYIVASDFNATIRKTVKVLVSTSYSGPILPSGPFATVPAQIALDRLRSMPNWLPNYDIMMESLDDQACFYIQLMSPLNNPF